jgi:tetratricopeptide (TPR) repeat protein
LQGQAFGVSFLISPTPAKNFKILHQTAMKKFILTTTLLLTTVIALPAQELATLVENSIKAMDERKWEQGLAFGAQAIEKHGSNPKDALDLWGPQFGTIHYRKGICELQLNKFADAMKSFESCYKDFPNSPEKDGNNFNKMALLKWGEAAMGAEKYDVAIEQWLKFINERSPRDRYPQGLFHINLAICYYNTGNIAKGNEHLEIAIKNKAAFGTPNTSIVSAFQVLVSVSLKEESDQALLDFLEKNKGVLSIEPYEMQRFSKVFMKLAGDAIAAEKVKTALALYRFIPPTEVAIDDLNAKIKSLGKMPALGDGSSKLVRAQMETDMAALKTELSSTKSLEMIKLAAIAYIYEDKGYVPGAYAAYYQLETSYSRSEKREDNLFNLIRTASLLGKLDKVQQYGDIFLKTYPESKRKPDIMKLMLSSLFFSGAYNDCILIASDLISKEKLKVPSQEHDLALFVLGGSYFYTGQYEAAGPHLDKHITSYPESTFAMQSSYFQASNVYRRQLWKDAAKLLDAFLEKYKTNADQSYIPLALLDRANTHYSEDEMEATLEKVERLIKDFPDNESTIRALNLKGNVLEGQGKIEDAIASYKLCLEKAEAGGIDTITGDALYFLTALLSSDKSDEDSTTRFPTAVAYADKYWAKYSEGSPYRAQTAVGQLPAMVGVGRGEEGLKRLQGIISEMAKLQEEAYGLEEAINSYTEAYLKSHTPEELKEHYFNFPGVDVQDKVARALLRIAVIGVFEGLVNKAKEDKEKRDLNAMIQVLFQNLKTEFDVKELSNFILVKLGDYLRTKTAAPLESLPYYNEALGRTDKSYQFDALLGRADVYGKSPQPDQLAKSIEDFERVLADSDDKGQREFSLYRIVQVFMAKGEYEAVAKRANEYLNRDEAAGPAHGFTKYSAEIGYILAQSFEKRNMTEDALQMYVKVWSTYMGNIKISAPAIHTWMELAYRRNNPAAGPGVPSDRQGAYEGGYRYIELTGRFKDKLPPEERALWDKVEKLTEKYVADPAVKSMEQIKKEKEAAGQ